MPDVTFPKLTPALADIQLELPTLNGIERFGNWTILEHRGRKPRSQQMALARCDCGTEKVIQIYKSNNCRQCSAKLKSTHLRIRESYVGHRVGSLSIASYLGFRKKYAYYRCRCDCGSLVDVAAFRILRNDKPKTHCGCITKKKREDINAVRKIEVVASYIDGESIAAIQRRMRIAKVSIQRWVRESGCTPHKEDLRWLAGHRKRRCPLKVGYVLVWIDRDHQCYDMCRRTRRSKFGGWLFEHRLVLAIHVGRNLDPWEIVHHRDGNKSNNTISNLELKASTADHNAETHAQINLRRLRRENLSLADEVRTLKDRLAAMERYIT